MTTRHRSDPRSIGLALLLLGCINHVQLLSRSPMGIDFHLIANFAALFLITLVGPAVIFILFYRRGAL